MSPGNPLCDDLTSDKVFEWLPLWRWTRTTWLFSDIDADYGDWLTRKIGIGNVADLFVGLVVQLPLQIAGFIWEITSYLLYLALNPVFYVKLFYHTFGKAEELWAGAFRDALSPQGGTTLLAMVLLISTAVIIWRMLRPPPGGDKRRPFVRAVGSLILTIIPLSLVFMMLNGTRINGKSIPLTVMTLTQTFTEAIGNELQKAAYGFSDVATAEGQSTATIPLSCVNYIAALEDLFRDHWERSQQKWLNQIDNTAADSRLDSTKNLYTFASTGRGSGGVRQELPVLASRMWTDSFYYGLGMAQFGDPVAVRRATCFLTEWRVKSTTAAEQQAILDRTNAVTADPNRSWSNTERIRAEDRLHPDGTDAERALLTLAAACMFTPYDQTDLDAGHIEAKNLRIPIPPPGPYTFDGNHTAILRTGDPPVMLDPRWAGMFNNKERAFRPDKTVVLDAEACKEWMAPSACSAMGACKWKPRGGSGAGFVTGVRAEWLQDKANITVSDVKRSLETRRTAIADGQRAGQWTPGDGDVEKVREIVRTVQGLNVMKRVLFALAALATAVVFLLSLGGLTLGVLLAQFILALTLLLLPLLLLATAFPIERARQLLKKLVRVWVASALSYTVFFTALALLMLIITMVDGIAAVFLPVSDGSLLDVLIIPFVALLSVKLLRAVAKTLGADITSFKGAVQFTSGMTAAGMRLPGRAAYAGYPAGPQTPAQPGAAGRLGRITRGIRAARTVGHSYGKGLEKARKVDGHSGIAAFGHALKNSAVDGYKESVLLPMNLATMSKEQREHYDAKEAARLENMKEKELFRLRGWGDDEDEEEQPKKVGK